MKQTAHLIPENIELAVLETLRREIGIAIERTRNKHPKADLEFRSHAGHDAYVQGYNPGFCKETPEYAASQSRSAS